MPRFWSTVLTVISTIAAVLGVAIAVFVFVQGRSDQSKKLEIELIAQSTLVNENVQTKQRIEILYDGRKIPNYVILQIRVANTGGQPIRSIDYEENLQLDFGTTAHVLSAEQASSDPKELRVLPSVITTDPAGDSQSKSSHTTWVHWQHT